MPPHYPEIIRNFALQAAEQYGTAEDGAFTDAYEQAAERHLHDANVDALTLYCHSFQAAYPGNFTPNGYPNTSTNTLTWYMQDQAHEKLPPELGDNVRIDIFARVVLSRSAARRKDAHEVAEALSVEREGKPSRLPSLLGHEGIAQRKLVGKVLFEYDPSAIRELLSRDVLEKPDELSIRLAGQAQLPDAPMTTIDDCSVKLDLKREREKRESLRTTPARIAGIRSFFKRVGVAALPKHIVSYYEHEFGYTENLPDWTKRIPKDYQGFDLQKFRDAHTQASELLHVLRAASPITELPENAAYGLRKPL